MSVALILKKWSENVQPGTLRKCYYRNFLGYLPCMLVFTSPIHLNLGSYPFQTFSTGISSKRYWKKCQCKTKGWNITNLYLLQRKKRVALRARMHRVYESNRKKLNLNTYKSGGATENLWFRGACLSGGSSSLRAWGGGGGFGVSNNYCLYSYVNVE